MGDIFNKIDINMINSDTEVWMSGYHFVAGKYLNKLNGTTPTKM